jgi:hypothetical protein
MNDRREVVRTPSGHARLNDRAGIRGGCRVVWRRTRRTIRLARDSGDQMDVIARMRAGIN